PDDWLSAKIGAAFAVGETWCGQSSCSSQSSCLRRHVLNERGHRLGALESRLLTGRHALDYAVQSSRGIAPYPNDERGRRHDIGDLFVLGGAHVATSSACAWVPRAPLQDRGCDRYKKRDRRAAPTRSTPMVVTSAMLSSDSGARGDDGAPDSPAPRWLPGTARARRRAAPADTQGGGVARLPRASSRPAAPTRQAREPPLGG